MSNDLNYYLHDGSGVFRFQLVGRLSNRDTRHLEQAWRTASSIIGGKCLIVDLSQVTGIDESGRELLDKWHAHGARLIVTTSEAKTRIESMTAVTVMLLAPVPKAFAWNRLRAATPWLAALFVFLFPAIAA